MRLQFIIGEIFVGIRRNLAMVVSLVLVTFVSLYLFGIGMLAGRQVEEMKQYWDDRIQVSIFLCNKDDSTATCGQGAATDEEKQAIRDALDSPQLKPLIEDYHEESRAEAYKRFTAQFKDSTLTANVTEEQMPESFRIRLKDPSKYQVISQTFATTPGVQSVQDQNQVIKRLFSLLKGLKNATYAIACVMLLSGVLLVGVTIRLTAFSRRRETAIMRLVGASDFVIRAPFVLEGMAAAMIGALLASGGLWTTAKFGVQGWLSDRVTALRWVDASATLPILPWLFVGGLVISGVSSWVVLQRYLKV